MIVASSVLSLNGRTRPRWRTVVPTTDHHRVRPNIPNTPLSNILQVSTNGHMRWTVFPKMVRPAHMFWFSETLLLRLSNIFWVSSYGHIRQTVIPSMVVPAQPFGLWETMFLRSPTFSKCPLTDIYDGPSYPRRFILHKPSWLSETPLLRVPILVLVSHDGHRRWTVIITMVHYAYAS